MPISQKNRRTSYAQTSKPKRKIPLPQNKQQKSPQHLLQRAIQTPGSLALNDWHTIQATIGNRKAQQLIQRQTQVKSPIVKAPSGQVQRFAWDDDPGTWDDLDSVTRSGEGVKGVFFFKKGGTTVVVKPTDESPQRLDFANKFNQGQGFITPEMKYYTKGSSKGKALAKILMANQDAGRSETEVKDQVDGATHIMVMNIVDGNSIQRLDGAEMTEMLQNNKALVDIGKLMVTDTFIGNTDRLMKQNLGQFNLGNFFYRKTKVGTAGGIATIDNDVNFSATAKRVEGKRKRFEYLLKKDTLDLHLGAFVAKIKGIHKHRENQNVLTEIDDNSDRIKTKIEDGVKLGLAEVANLDVEKIGDIKNYGWSQEQYSTAKGLSRYVKARLAGDNENTAKGKLTKYLRYRKQRDWTSKGFKWGAKLFWSNGF